MLVDAFISVVVLGAIAGALLPVAVLINNTFNLGERLF